MDVASGPHQTGVQPLAEGRWLRLDRVSYTDPRGQARTWEAARRRGGQGAVCMITRLIPSDRFVLIQQYRPPVDAFAIEFPAGLIDAGETPEAAAVRELREETGYQGTIRWVSPPALNSPGLTDESAVLVRLDVDETAPGNRLPTPQTDEGEHIRVYTVGRREVRSFLETQARAGVRLDNKVLTFFLGLGVLP